MHQKICTRHTTVSVYSDAKTISEARRCATALLGVVHELQCSSSQSEPEWLLFNLSENFKQFDTDVIN